MNLYTDADPCFPRTLRDEVYQHLTRELAFPANEAEEDEIQIALAESRAENEVQVAQAVSEALQEEEDVKKAIYESQASFQQEREVRDLMQVTDEIDQLEVAMMVALSIEAQEQTLEWLPETPDAENDYDWFTNGYYEGHTTTLDVELPVLYKNYRLVPTMFTENEMWPPSAIQQQVTELLVNRGMEDIREWQETQSEDDRCLVCLTNIATRIAVPCGHRLSCRSCLSRLVRQDNYYTVTAADGQVVQTDRRVPIQCCTCRAIIGQIVTIH